MSVSKRTRFEVLRRDKFTCQYCGDKAPDVVLNVDHVMPIALGGSDGPDNLVTACKPCNTGKSSIAPDSPLVQSMGAQAAAYTLGMQDKMTRFRAEVQSLDDYADEFRELWDQWKTDGTDVVPLRADYKMSLFRWMQMGIPIEVYGLAIPSAMTKRNRSSYMDDEDVFAYMAGIVWNMINAREIDYSVTADTAAVYTEREMESISESEYSLGRETGLRLARAELAVR